MTQSQLKLFEIERVEKLQAIARQLCLAKVTSFDQLPHQKQSGSFG